MRKIVIAIIGLSTTLSVLAQENKKKGSDFDDFIQEQSRSFDQFIDQANQDFINFMRDPWTQLKAEEPVEQRKEPEPDEPTVYDGQGGEQQDDVPICLDIEDILDQSTVEGQQQPTTEVTDLDDLLFDDLPDDPTTHGRRKRPVVVVVDDEPANNPPSGQRPSEQTPAGQAGGDQAGSGSPAGQGNTPGQGSGTAGSGISGTGGAAGTGSSGGSGSAGSGNPPAAVVAPTDPATTPSIDSSQALYAGGSDRSALTYAGNTYYLSNQLKGQCALAGTSEGNVADAYQRLAQANYTPLVNDFTQLRTSGIVNDWMTFKLVEQVAKAYCSKANEAVVMQYFLLSQLGFKTRIARKASGGQLVLFTNVDCQLYGCIYIEQDGLKYYDVGNKTPYTFYMCQQNAPRANTSISMSVNRPIYTGGGSQTHTHQAQGSTATVSAPVPTQLMNVYATYPQCDYRVYATAAVNPAVAQAILTPLSAQIRGKSEIDAANLLLNFVQTAFAYATDGQQFGYEKPFFVEELFYYPYCDCEDRSVLFGYLVKQLLNLDVVYLDYPNHIATAVHFNTDPGGDYFNVGGRKYTVCDPTYIGASIGMTMPQYKTVAATILKY